MRIKITITCASSAYTPTGRISYLTLTMAEKEGVVAEHRLRRSSSSIFVSFRLQHAAFSLSLSLSLAISPPLALSLRSRSVTITDSLVSGAACSPVFLPPLVHLLVPFTTFSLPLSASNAGYLIFSPLFPRFSNSCLVAVAHSERQASSSRSIPCIFYQLLSVIALNRVEFN